MSAETFAAIHARADAGDPAAAAYSAVLAASGQGETQSWHLALERLARAAALGSVSAQDQLRVLAAHGRGGPADWEALAADVDLLGWLSPQPIASLHKDVRLGASRSFLPPLACRWLIHRAKGRLGPARLYGDEGGVTEAEVRSNSVFDFRQGELDVVVLLVRARIAATVGAPVGAFETPQLLHYAPGQSFDPHFDALEPDVPAHAAQIAEAGQRKTTFLVYLNTGFEGGETDFPALGVRFKGSAGDALMFANLTAEGLPDRLMLHAGLAPTSGEKWLLSQWIRDR